MLSLDRYLVTEDGQIYDRQNDLKPIKQFKSNGYTQCCIFDENGKHVVGVHSVVAQAYCSDWFEGCVVHHKDENKHNNKASNLECFARDTHSKMHQPKKYFDKTCICPTCKKSFIWTGKRQSHYYRDHHKYGPFCCRECATHRKQKVA